MSEEEAPDRLAARELPSAVNSPELLAEHYRITGGKIRTRFPPEPNGYLHVGHCKSMNMNFELAFEKLNVPMENRQTYFRYDDTNPEAECDEYIESLRQDVAWMGWKPNPTTFSSDYFAELYDFAIELIKRDKAYICHQTKAEMEASREICRAKLENPNAPGDPNSPWRNRPIEESLREFDNMRKGKYASGAAVLRMKMDMTSPNPNMWDQVAYRIKYVPHPHIGDKWCIYPTYDYTHCLIDSIEHIDYSICTLEFETRRESYYWVLEALDLYRPKVYEMSRLNLTYTVLSKRKLLKLVFNGYMRGWDDPRMPTIKGLRRRGYTAEILNAFCREIGATRNENYVQYERLNAIARNALHLEAPRVMAVLNSLKVTIVNLDDAVPADKRVLSVHNFPFDAAKGSHTVTMSSVIYIDDSDFRLTASEDFFGLTPNGVVGLKYACRIRCVSYELDSNGKCVALTCEAISDANTSVDKPKSTIQWVPVETAVEVEVRMYDTLFVNETVNDENWESELNPNSEVVIPKAYVDSSVTTSVTPEYGSHVQFERIGFFVFDKDTTTNRLVLNLTVALKDSKPKSEVGASRSRKAEQEKQLAEKMAKMSLRAEEMFLSQTDLYSKFDEEGVPTHSADGEPISKSGLKKLKKEWEKQKRLYEQSQAK